MKTGGIAAPLLERLTRVPQKQRHTKEQTQIDTPEGQKGQSGQPSPTLTLTSPLPRRRLALESESVSSGPKSGPSREQVLEEEEEEEEEESEPGGEDDETLIPDKDDEVANANKPKPGQIHISPAAIKARLRRCFIPNRYGCFKVSDQLLQDFRSGGGARRRVEQIFQMCGYNKESGLGFYVLTNWGKPPFTQDTFVQEAELLRTELTSSEITITEEDTGRKEMLEQWKWSPSHGRIPSLSRCAWGLFAGTKTFQEQQLATNPVRSGCPNSSAP